jgi:hypothetical protein
LDPPGSDDGASTNALGDWFVNRLVVDRKPLLILVSAATLFPILDPAKNVRSLPERLTDIVRDRLGRLAIPSPVVESEAEATRSVVVGKTNNRSVVGTMIDFAKAVPFYLPEGGLWGRNELRVAEEKLAYTPCRCSSRSTVWPDQEVVRALMERWTEATVVFGNSPKVN